MAKNEKNQGNNLVKIEKIQRKTKVRQNNEGDRNLSPKILSLTTFSSFTRHNRCKHRSALAALSVPFIPL